jgi:predicted ATPase
LDNPFSIADALCYAGCFFYDFLRDAQATREHAEELLRLSKEKNYTGWLGMSIQYLGSASAGLGRLQEGIELMREGIVVHRAEGMRLNDMGTLGSLAQALAETGQVEEGLAALAEALELMEQTDERLWEAELYRIRGELLLMQGREADAESGLHDAERSFQHAIVVARDQQARSWELRATTSLARLWQAQGKQEEAREVLAGVYGWFTEGYGTADLREAKALLEQLS